jgi:2-polyprenyl-3-methyl-5-hydroxy-6-metoxy-1,4-benzoquinol methylase
MPNINEQRRYYTDRWGAFEYANHLELRRLAQVLTYMSDIEMPAIPRICDLGCGAGWSTNVLSMFGQVIGVDLSDTTIAQTRYPLCRFISADVIEWDAPKAEFDVVVSLEVLEHIEESAQGRYLGVAHRLLKPGGYLILTTPNKQTMNAIRGGGRTWSDQPIENWLGPDQLRSLLKQSGFIIESWTSLILGVASLKSHRLIVSHRINRLMRALGLYRIWQGAACRMNYGLHLAVLAKKY